jgi:hypothetical protein
MFHRLTNGAKRVVSQVRTKAAVAGGALAVLAGNASATTGTGGFDSSTIVAKIEANAVEATLIIGAFILAVWGLRAMGLLGKRG